MNFNEIWSKHKAHLQNFIKSRVDDEDFVDDILQEISIKLHDNLGRNVEIRNYKNWLFQVTRNSIADHYKNKKYTSDLSIIQFQIYSESNPCVCDLSEFIIKKYLPEMYAKPLYLSDIEQRQQQEIAEILNLSLAATKSRIQRGRKKLKELITGCVNISYNKNGQISDFQLKNNCELPQELKTEMEKINLLL